MAKVSFYYRGKSANGKLSVRLVHTSAKIDYMVSSQIESKKEYWQRRTTEKGKTVIKRSQWHQLNKGDAISKKHHGQLQKIHDYVIDQFVKDFNSGLPITKDWLRAAVAEKHDALTDKKKIDEVVSEAKEIENANLLTSAIEQMLTKYKTNPREFKKYKVTLNRLQDYQNQTKTTFKIKDLNTAFADRFKNWAYLDMKYSKSYINALLKRLRASAVKAYENDETNSIELSKTARTFEMFKEPYKGKIVVTLDYSELDKIENTATALQDAKKAILIGCETGLRYSDMNKLIDTNIRNIDGVNYWEFRTNKTDKLVQIPITERILNLINKYGLPLTDYPDNGVQFNRDIQKVCKDSGIVEEIRAKRPSTLKVKGEKVKRYVTDKYPKYKLITSRTLRRSFATNYYGKIDTALITSITGHQTEQMLRAYINQDDNANVPRTKEQIDQFHKERKEKKNNFKLTVIPKTASN